MKLKKWGWSLVMALSIAATGCSKDMSPGDYDSEEVGKIKKVVPGVIVSMRPVRLHNKAAESAVISDTDTGTGRSHGFEYVIKLNSGSIISVVQAENIKLKNKQHILVIYGRNTRVVPDNGSENY
ncbi:hypothetical protein [Legionella sp. CNM-4043-24]|uniref:hypothetical protein n=1 Tax=Legionella sp. CNM-4043-24 TaxID=3421646 RepID=UPI00403AF589